MIVIITAEVDMAKKTVVLSTDQKGLDPDLTFRVKQGDTVQWKVRGALRGLRLRVNLVEYPAGTGKPGRLFKEGTKDTLPATTKVVVGTVDRLAAKGRYFYEVALVGGSRPNPLRCLWAAGPGQPAKVLTPAMGGGVKTDPPPG